MTGPLPLGGARPPRLRAARAVALVAFALIAAACAPAYRGEALSGPLDTSDPQVAAGQRSFARHCHQCHPGASAGLGPSITPIAAIVRLQVRAGLGAMPAFDEERLPDDELDDVVAYLMKIREHGLVLRRP